MPHASAVLALCLLVCIAPPAFAQSEPGALPPGALFAVEPAPAPAGTLVPVPQLRVDRPFEDGRRSQALVPLYSWLITLNAMDVQSTRRGLATGRAREANPLMRPFVKSTGGFVALKAGLTASTIYFAEKNRRKHPKKVLAWMIATDVALAAVVAHNYRVAARAR